MTGDDLPELVGAAIAENIAELPGGSDTTYVIRDAVR
jgi:hypothetical protein